MAGRTFRTRGTTELGRAHTRWLFAAGAVLIGGLLAVAAEAATQPAYAAKASITPKLYYIGDSAGSVYSFTVKNTGTSTSIGAVRISRPATWTVTSCPTPPAGWTATASATMCRFRSAATKSDDIKPGAAKTFHVKAKTDPGTANRTGTWPVVVSSTNHFSTTSALKAASATGAGLRTTLYTFELTTAVVRDVAPLPGTACPAADKSAVLGSNATIVVCGKNRATTALTPSNSYSTLGGTFVQTPGTFVSGSIPKNSANVVLANWTATTVSGTYGTGKKVIAGIGSSANRRSPLRTFTGFSALSRPPVAVDNAYATDEDTALVVADSGVLGNDSDPEADPLTARNVTNPANGTLTVAPEGGFTYTPNADFHGVDSFTYTAFDTHTDSAAATVTITVNPVNDAPTAQEVSATTVEDTAKAVTLAGGDVDGDPLTYTVVSGPSHGSVGAVVGDAVTYTPDADYHGADSFTYRANDGTADSPAVTVSLTVDPVNDAPVADADAHSTDEDVTLDVAAPGVLGDDSDVDGDALTAVLVAGPEHGTVTLNADGSFAYVPAADYHGADAFTYRATDGTLDSAVTTVALTVDPVNDAPTTAPVAVSTDEDTAKAVTLAGADVDGDPLTYAVVTGPAHGSLGAVAGDEVTYTPDADYHGADSFTFTVNDGTVDSASSVVTVTVDSVNDLPVAGDDAYATDEDTALVVAAPGVLADDSDKESPLTAARVTGPAHGTLTLGSDGSFTYTPTADYHGADSFTYRANDGTADSGVATVELTVNPVNDVPTASSQMTSTSEDTAKAVTLAGSDVEGAVTYAIVTGPAHGSLGALAGDQVTYTPDADYHGADSFTFKVTDGDGVDSGVATVDITVNPVNDAPVAGDDAYSTDEDTPLTVPAPGVLGDDSDVDGDTLAAALVTGVSHGTLTLNGDGSFTYTPAADYHGADSFTYDAGDGNGGTAAATVAITVAAVNDAPTASDVSVSTAEDTAKAVTLAGDDVEGSVTYAVVDGPNNGTLGAVSGDEVTYTPDADYHGPDSFTYRTNDGTTDSALATVSITVTPVNDAPVAGDDGPFQTLTDQELTLTAPGVLANDVDVDGDALTAGNASDPANGTVTLNADGSFGYTPDLGYTGTDTFTYDVSDGTVTDTATVTVTVVPPNATPTAAAATGSGLEDGGAITVALSGTDSDGDALTFSAGTAGDGTVGTPGTVDCATTPGTCTASVTYTPDTDFNGTDTFTYTVNDGTIDSAAATATVTVTPVNDAPSFTKGADQTVDEDAGPQTVAGWASAISAGPANEAAQTVSFTVTTSNDALFSAAPAVDAAGQLSYTPGADKYGAATVSVTAVDTGGTANGGDADGPAQTFTITVDPVNDVPVADDDTHEVTEDTAEDIAVLTGDTDADPTDTLTPTLLTNTDADTNDGALTVNPNGTVAYDPAGEFDHLQVGDTETDTFTYTVDDGNGGTDTATVTVTVTGVNDAPVAVAKSHTAIGNTLLAVNEPAPSAPHTSTTSDHLLVGVTDPDDTVFTASSGTASANGGTVTTDSDGSFLFLPAQGHTGSDTFTFTVTDAHGGTDTDTATVTISNMVWYVDTDAVAAGTGRSSDPFKTLAPITTGGSADTKDGSGDHIFVYEGAYTGGLVLEPSQKLWGEPQGLSVAGTPLVSAGGANPTISHAAGHGITLANGVDVQRVNVGASSGFGISGASITNATVGSNTTVNDGVSLTGSATGTVTVASTISNTANQAVVVANRTGGSVTFSGPVTSTGAGVGLTSNGGATVALTGQLALTTTTNDGFVATGGGTVSAPHTANAVTTTAGRGVVVQNTTIGADDLVLRSVNVNTAGSAAPANGIVLDNTGSTGNLVVTGTGAAASGGTIRNTTGAGVSLTSTRDTALTHVRVQDAGGDGIHGSGITNLSLTGVQVLGAGDADEERALDLTNAGGTVAISGGTYDDAADDLVKVKNASTNVTVNVGNGATFSNQTQALAGNAFDFAPDGTSAITASITGSTFSNLKNTSVNFGATTLASSGTSALTFTGNTVSGGAGGAAGVTVSGQENTTTSVIVSNNTFSGAGGNGVLNHDVNDNSNVYSTVTNNSFTSPKGHAIVGAVDEDGDVRMRIDGNTISNAGGDGIELTNFGDDSPAAMTSTASFIVTNNTVNGHSLNAATQFVGAIAVFNFENDADTTCARVSGNTVTGTPVGFYDVFLQDNGVGRLKFEEVPNTAATGTVANAYIQSLNPGTTLTNIDNVGAVYSDGVACTAP